jgi:transcriptional regulator with XRE-family HTH domain
LNTIGDHLKKKRLDLGLLQREVAKRIGVDKSTIQYWETNRVAPAIRHMPRLIRFLGYAPYTPARSFSEKLTRARWYLGLSRKKMARILKIDESTLAGWETGRHRPTRRPLKTIYSFFTRWMPHQDTRVSHRRMVELPDT